MTDVGAAAVVVHDGVQAVRVRVGGALAHIAAELQALRIADGLVDLVAKDAEAFQVHGQDHGRLLDAEALGRIDALVALIAAVLVGQLLGRGKRLEGLLDAVNAFADVEAQIHHRVIRVAIVPAAVARHAAA